jgi:hypothetical protein
MQIREIMVFLHSHGVSAGRAVRIYKTYGNLAIQTVQEKPSFTAEAPASIDKEECWRKGNLSAQHSWPSRVLHCGHCVQLHCGAG